ncbi:MAG: M20/M25/M40 family metallo-hydrolase [Candidatus Acidiferrales bacterium]
MKNRLSLAAILLLASFPLAAQETPAVDDALLETDRRILAEIADHSEQMDNLRYLTDVIGARLTGTDALRRANQWTAERFRAYGLSNVHLEPWSIAHSWKRGRARASVLSPTPQPLAAEVAGWSPDTAGTVRGRLVYVSARKAEELEQYRGKLRGTIAITTEPTPRQRVEERPVQPREPKPEPDYEALRKFAAERDAFFKEEGVLGLLRDSDKSFGLFQMTVAGRDFKPAAIPAAFLAPESYDLTWRLLQNEKEVELELTLEGNEFSAGPVEVYNTVAELPGSEQPEEVVILGAHLDSWDLATGATDNGTGVTAVLEAARALVKLGLRPKRTIRFVFFTGEEQGLHGSREYVEAHKDELEKISAVLVHDSGTGRVETLALQGNPQAYDVVRQAMAPFRQLIGLKELTLQSSRGSDHHSFNRRGVPGFFCSLERATYSQTHHSQADTFDKVVRDDVLNGAQVLAVFAYNIAQLDSLLPRRPAEPAP